MQQRHGISLASPLAVLSLEFAGLEVKKVTERCGFECVPTEAQLLVEAVVREALVAEVLRYLNNRAEDTALGLAGDLLYTQAYQSPVGVELEAFLDHLEVVLVAVAL